jgi:hypothetical protein
MRREYDMTKKIALFGTVLMIAVVAAVPAFAVNGSGGAGRDYGQHHAAHAQEMGGFTGTMNPGVMHQGFSGWTGM